jgi:hypothetical protein
VKFSRGGALPETAVTLGVVLTLLFGTFELGLIGLAQLAGDGAAFVAAHASVLGNDPNAAIAAPFPLVAQNATVNIQRTAPDPSQVAVDFQLADQSNRHGGVQIVRPAQTQATVTNGGVGIGNILPTANLSSAAIEANMMVSGFGFNLDGSPMNSAQTYADQKNYFVDDGNAPPYFIGFKFLYHCNPTPHSGCQTNASMWSGGFAEMLDGSNWSRPASGIAPGGVYEAMSIHQRVYATIAKQLDAAEPAVVLGDGSGTVLDPSTSNPNGACIRNVMAWDARVTVGVPLGSTDTSHDPLNPLYSDPACS